MKHGRCLISVMSLPGKYGDAFCHKVSTKYNNAVEPELVQA